MVQVDQVKQAQSAGLWDAARRGLVHQVLVFRIALSIGVGGQEKDHSMVDVWIVECQLGGFFVVGLLYG